MINISNRDFTHIHNHTEYSAFDGLNKISSFPMEARKMGFRALGITDHGNVGGIIKFFNECQKTTDKDGNKIEYAPIIPILGCEFYLAKNRFAKTKNEQPDGRKGNRHIVLIAKNWAGYQNLCRLSEHSWVDGFYNDPRIDFELLEKYHEGLICSTACLSSVVNANLLHGRYDVAKKTVSKFKDLFGEDLYLEIMFHGIDAERLIT
jgi:DNA polymerase-3 subunit alpha